MSLLPHQERVVHEKIALDVKLSDLNRFIDSAGFDGLHHAERARLTRQSRYMAEYSNVLGERIAAFPPQPAA